MEVLVIIVGLGIALGFTVAMFLIIAKRRGSIKESVRKLEGDLKSREDLLAKVHGLFSQMVSITELREKAEEYRSFQESLKAERGRITITQAELETVEGRLRELEEIERELEASGLETKEELNILTKKKDELVGKNDALKEQLMASLAEIDNLMQEIEMSSQMEEQINNIKSEIIQTQQRVDMVLIQIEQGNDQYFILKKRYDALDIEYAQLYEKFSETEIAASSGEES